MFQVQLYYFDDIGLPGDLNEFAEASLYALYKTTFQVSLLYWPDELCPPGDLNECVEAYLYTLYKTIFKVSLSYWLDKLCLLGDMNKWADSFPVSPRNGLFKTILPLKLSHQHKGLSPGKMAQGSVSEENGLKYCLPDT